MSKDGHVLVALVRGINVGRAKRVPMAGLREIVTQLGHADVKTLLNSGNIVFSAGSADPAIVGAGIEEGIQSRFGVSARVTILSAGELETAIEANPLVGVADNPSRLFVGFLSDDESQTRVEPLLNGEWSPAAFALGPRVAYLWCPEGVLSSPLYDEFTRLLGDLVTARNWRTTLRIQAAVQALKSSS